jgi:hypothetical protein
MIAENESKNGPGGGRTQLHRALLLPTRSPEKRNRVPVGPPLSLFGGGSYYYTVGPT